MLCYHEFFLHLPQSDQDLDVLEKQKQNKTNETYKQTKKKGKAQRQFSQQVKYSSVPRVASYLNQAKSGAEQTLIISIS